MLLTHLAWEWLQIWYAFLGVPTSKILMTFNPIRRVFCDFFGDFKLRCCHLDDYYCCCLLSDQFMDVVTISVWQHARTHWPAAAMWISQHTVGHHVVTDSAARCIRVSGPAWHEAWRRRLGSSVIEWWILWGSAGGGNAVELTATQNDPTRTTHLQMWWWHRLVLQCFSSRWRSWKVELGAQATSFSSSEFFGGRGSK